MSEIVIDGFKFMRWPHGKQFMIVESDRLAECVAYCKENNIKWLHVTPSHGYLLDNLDFLCDCSHVVGVFLMSDFADMSGLYCLTHLSFLSAICDHAIELSAFPLLSDLSTDWSPRIHETLLASRSLSRLWLRGYKPANRDLVDLSTLHNLKHLHVVLSTISCIRGIETLSAVSDLEFSHCRNLTGIQPVAALNGSLEELRFGHCKRIDDLTYVSVLKGLRKLILTDCHSLPSIRFIKEMPSLEFFSFVNTPVLDGDMTPCFGLRYAGFMNKRHYSHTYEEVRAEIERRTGGNSLYED